jgi:hypothetical protein
MWGEMVCSVTHFHLDLDKLQNLVLDTGPLRRSLILRRVRKAGRSMVKAMEDSMKRLEMGSKLWKV